MILNKFSLVLLSLLFVGLNLAQNKKNRESLDRLFVRVEEPAEEELVEDPEPILQVLGPKPRKKMTVQLMALINGKQHCPRLQYLGAKLLNDRKYCDIDLEVIDSRINESRVFCAHRSILSLRSRVLNDRITQLLKNTYGTQKPRLRIEGLNPDVFEYILQFIYTDKIDADFNLKQNIMYLYVAAEYVDIPDLVDMIKEYLYLSLDPIDIVKYLKWAHKYGYKEIKKFLLEITRTALKMTQNEWREFLISLCESCAPEKGVLGVPYDPHIAPTDTYFFT